MGFTFLAPDPTLPPKPEELPEFNAFDAMNEPCLKVAPLLPPTPPPQTLFLPGPAIAPRDSAQNWTTAQAAWNAADMSTTALLVQRWTNIFGWADKSRDVAPVALPKPKPAPNAKPVQGQPPPTPILPIKPFTPLVPSRPQHLVDDLGTFYLSAPCLSALDILTLPVAPTRT
jgi:hypothetical protein